MRILQVSTADVGGGAEGVALRLFETYRRRGHDSWLAVGNKLSSQDADVLAIPWRKESTPWYDVCTTAAGVVRLCAGRSRRLGRLSRWLEEAARPWHWLQRVRGHEDFAAWGTRRLLRLPPRVPDVIHCHNLHGGGPEGGNYFDLTALPWLSGRVPVVMTLHDAWLLSGHCAHSFDCERWQSGCGRCPDLTIFPALERDGTAQNWRRKRDVFGRSRLFIATPCRWLMDRVERSILAPALQEGRVIPNGVDLSVFRPADRGAVRAALGMPQDAKVLLFTANAIRNSIWKDYRTMREAVGRAAERLRGTRLLFVALGEGGPPEQVGPAQVCFVPYEKDPRVVASYYQAADVYVHAARADTFPTTVLESLACGTPVIATAVGGIPEQLRGPGEPASGVLVPPGDATAMAAAVERLLTDDQARRRMAEAAVEDARRRFDLERQAEAYLQWYNEILARHGAAPAGRPSSRARSPETGPGFPGVVD